MSNKRLLVHLHLFYHNQIDDMINYLSNINNCDFDLFVTVTEENKESQDKLLRFNPDTRFIQVPNLGYDIWPFIVILRMIDLKDYDYILKIHTKSYRYANICGLNLQGFDWRNFLINPLLGTKQIFKNNLLILDNCSSIGMIASEKLHINLLNFPEDTFLLKIMKERLNIKTNYNKFIAGTMFLARSCIFEKIKDSNIDEQDFETVSNTQDIGTNAQTLERIFSILTDECGYSINNN